LEDISEKIIMNSIEMQNFCKKEVDSTIDRMHILCAEGRSKDAQALYNEIKDWVVKKNDIEVLSLDYLESILDDS